jgi:hypothetical protein
MTFQTKKLLIQSGYDHIRYNCDSERWPQKNSVPEHIQQKQITRNNQSDSFCKFSKLLKYIQKNVKINSKICYEWKSLPDPCYLEMKTLRLSNNNCCLLSETENAEGWWDGHCGARVYRLTGPEKLRCPRLGFARIGRSRELRAL